VDVRVIFLVSGTASVRENWAGKYEVLDVLFKEIKGTNTM
jgi:hypothetical protein